MGTDPEDKKMAEQCGWAGHSRRNNNTAKFLVTLARPCGHGTMTVESCDRHVKPVGAMGKSSECPECGINSGIRVTEVKRIE